MPKKKQELDQLETFFVVETTKLLGLYAEIRTSDPRGGAVTGDTLSQDEEVTIVKHSWASLVTYAQLYGYKRFATVNPDLETFYAEHINV
jgi:hypothetical protein